MQLFVILALFLGQLFEIKGRSTVSLVHILTSPWIFLIPIPGSLLISPSIINLLFLGRMVVPNLVIAMIIDSILSAILIVIRGVMFTIRLVLLLDFMLVFDGIKLPLVRFRLVLLQTVF